MDGDTFRRAATTHARATWHRTVLDADSAALLLFHHPYYISKDGPIGRGPVGVVQPGARALVGPGECARSGNAPTARYGWMWTCRLRGAGRRLRAPRWR